MIKLQQKRNFKNRQRGVALVAAMITLLIISAITAGMIILANTETNTSANFRDEQRAFFSAKGGFEEVRDRMRQSATDTLRTAGVLPTTLPGTSNSVLYVLNPLNGQTVAPWGGNPVNFADDEICKETTTITCSSGLPSGSGWYTTNTASTTYAASPVLDWKWVRLNLKQNNTIAPYYTNGASANTMQVCWNGTNEYADPLPGCTAPNLPIYVLTTLAVTPSGSRRMIQTEIAEDRLNFKAPSAVTLDGTGDIFTGGNSNQWGVNGIDQPGCGSTTVGPPVDAIGVPDNVDATTIAGSSTDIPRPGNYTGAGGTTPDVANVSSTMPANLQTVSSLQTLMSTVENNVTQPVLNGNVTDHNFISNGTVTDPQIIFVNGNVSISGSVTGYGILAVNGTVNITGTLTWNGIVLVIGLGNFTTSGTSVYNGAILVAQTIDPITHNLLTTPGPGSAIFNTNGGGHGGVQYSSGCIALATNLSTFHVVAIRELMN
jgi:Tfp pilus assembly protein PilX